MDSISEARLQLVHPQLAQLIRQMATQLSSQGVTVRVTQGLRSWTDQYNLWLKGRSIQGNIVDAAQVVTDAAPGYSWHNFALAVDVVPMTDLGPDWNVQHPAWQKIVAAGQALGLVSGSIWRTFPDWPHFQMPGIPTSPDDDTRAAFKQGGVPAVWQLYGLGVYSNGGARAQSQA